LSISLLHAKVNKLEDRKCGRCRNELIDNFIDKGEMRNLSVNMRSRAGPDILPELGSMSRRSTIKR